MAAVAGPWLELVKSGNVKELQAKWEQEGSFPSPFEDEEGKSALYVACSLGNLQTFKWLLTNETIPHEEPYLIIATENDQLEVVKFLVSRKEKDLNQTNLNGFTSLHLACARGNIKIVQLLLKNGAELDAKSSNGSTPLLLASGTGHLNIVKYLISKGSKTTERNKDGTSCLLRAVQYGHLDVVTFLISSGSQVDEQNQGGITTFLFACIRGHVEVAKFLLAQGSSKMEQDLSKKGCVFYAVMRNRNNIIKWLLAEGLFSLEDIEAEFTNQRKQGHFALLLEEISCEDSSKD